MCRRHEEGFCTAFSLAEDRQNFVVCFLPGACFVFVPRCRNLRQRQEKKTNSETLGKGSTKTAWKAEMKGFFIAGKISFNVQENVMGSNIENSLDLFSHSQKIKYFATLFCCPRGMPLPCGSCSCPREPWRSSASAGTRPAARLCGEGDTAARLPPLPGAAGAEHMDCLL